MPVNGDIQITFASGLDITGVEYVSGNEGVFVSTTGQVLTVNLGSALSASKAVSIEISGIGNPAFAGVGGTYAMETQNASDVAIDQGTAPSNDFTAPPVTGIPVFYPPNGHYYNVITFEGLNSWDFAKQDAKLQTFRGLQGHLATMTSPGENDFVETTFPNITMGLYGLGARQQDNSPATDVGWEWITGEAFVFTNWNLMPPSEPNDSPTVNIEDNEENCMSFEGGTPAEWNDISCTNPLSLVGYVVEFEPILASIFSDFSLKQALIKFNKLSESDSYDVEGSFTLGENSDGIDPLEEVVKLKVGTSNLEIPAGSFFQVRKRKYKFIGNIGDVRVHMSLKTLKSNTFRFMAWIKGIDLTDTSNPVPIGLYIGDDMGQTDIWLSGILKLK